MKVHLLYIQKRKEYFESHKFLMNKIFTVYVHLFRKVSMSIFRFLSDAKLKATHFYLNELYKFMQNIDIWKGQAVKRVTQCINDNK